MNFNRLFHRIKNEPEWVVLIGLVLLIAVGGGAFYYYRSQQQTQQDQQQFRRASLTFNRAGQTGNYDRSLTVLRRYLQNYPESTNADKARFFLGKSYFETGQQVSAIRQFRRLISNHPNSLFARSARLHIGYANLERDEDSQARRAFRKLLDETDDHPLRIEAQWQLAVLEYRLGNTDRAEKLLTRLLNSEHDLNNYWGNWARQLKNRLSAQS